MKNFYTIVLIDSDKNVVNYFQSYDNIISRKIVEKDNAKKFFEKAHAVACLEQFYKTSTTNKSKLFENKLEEFKANNPNCTFDISSNEINDVVHKIQININGEKFYLRGVDKETKVFLLTKEIEYAYGYFNYEHLKFDRNFCFEEKLFTNSQITILNCYIGEI